MLCEAIGPDKSLPTQFGGIVGITLFGPKAINAFVLPLALEYWEQWQEALAHQVTDLQQRTDLQMCQQAMLNALGVFLGPSNQVAPELVNMGWKDLEETFGDQLTMLSTHESEYTVCFV
jgi:transcription initiation factor TFIID subunit 6